MFYFYLIILFCLSFHFSVFYLLLACCCSIVIEAWSINIISLGFGCYFFVVLCSHCFAYVYERSRYSNAAGHGQRSNLAPQNMQWAIRSREASRSTGVRLAGGSNLVFIDPQSLRRSTTANAAVAASSEPITMATTASCLARAFGKLKTFYLTNLLKY